MLRVCLRLTILAGCLLAVSPPADNVVVWDFAARGKVDQHILDSFTDAFEESLLKDSGGLRIVERRNLGRLQEVMARERALQNAMDLPLEARKEFKLQGAGMVIFGEVFDDVDSGEVRIGVSFQTFEGQTVLKRSVLMTRGKLNDEGSRKEAMKKLVESITWPRRVAPELGTDQPPAEDDPEGVIRTSELNNVSKAAEKLVKVGKLKEALAKLESFRQKYPGTPQANQATLMMEQIRQTESNHE